MRLLLDECVPARLSKALPNHEVSTVVKAGWSGIKNGELLALAATQYEAFITVDKSLPHQQNPAALPIPIVVLDARSNELHHLLPLMPMLEVALQKLQPRSCVIVKAVG